MTPGSNPTIGGKYRIVGRLGAGGMGEIYKARHTLLDQWRAIKVMKSGSSGNGGRAERFRREARLAARLEHPNLARLFDFALAKDGTTFMVLEWIDGKSLRQILAEGGPPPVSWTLEVTRQTLEALHYLHEREIVHRDISPDNIMVTAGKNGKPLAKLIDLGIAKERTEELELTGEEHFLGKLRYAAPEAFMGPGGVRTLDRTADIYSLGVVLYELLTGETPFRGSSHASLVAAHLNAPPHSFDETDRSGRVPPEIRAVALTALAKDPGGRFQSAREFAGSIIDAASRLDPPQGDATASEASTLLLRPEVAESFPRLDEAQEVLDRQFSALVDESAPGTSESEDALGEPVGSPSGPDDGREAEGIGHDGDSVYSSVASTLVRVVREHPRSFAALGLLVIAAIVLATLITDPSAGTAATLELTPTRRPVSGTEAETPETRGAVESSPTTPLQSDEPLLAFISRDSGGAAALLPHLQGVALETRVLPSIEAAQRLARETSRTVLAVTLEIQIRRATTEAYEVALASCEASGSLLVLRLPETTLLHSQASDATAATCGEATRSVSRALATATVAAVSRGPGIP